MRGLWLKTNSLLVPFLFSKIFEKLVDHLKKCGPFTGFQYGFRSSSSTANIFTVRYGRTVRVFSRSEVNKAVAIFESNTLAL